MVNLDGSGARSDRMAQMVAIKSFVAVQMG